MVCVVKSCKRNTSFMLRVLNRLSVSRRVQSLRLSKTTPLFTRKYSVESADQIRTHPENGKYKVGNDIHGWKLNDIKYIPEFNVTTYLCEHNKTGLVNNQLLTK
jgi:hypothetical protein